MSPSPTKGKNGNGEGSIYEHKRNGKKVGYRGAYTVYTASGPKRLFVTGKTRDEVHDKLMEALGNRAQGLVFDAGPDCRGVPGAMADGLRKGYRASEHLLEVHRHMIQPHIVPALGRLKLKDLNPVHVRGFYREKLDSGLSAATVRKMHSILRKALKQAVLDGLVLRNVCEAVKPPKVERKEISPLDREQAKALLEASRGAGDRLEALYVLAIHTGMREGELLGLKWEDVDLERGVLRLRHGLVREGSKTTIGDLKTPKSRRSNPSNLCNRSFKPLLKRAALPNICFHDLWHTCATLLLSQGTHPKLLQELLGHANIAMTLDTHSHFLPSIGDQTVRAMEAALS